MSEHNHYPGTDADRCEVCNVELAAPDYKALATDALRALVDVVETNSGGWEHFDDHCTPETECCAGHVARILDRPEARALLEPET